MQKDNDVVGKVTTATMTTENEAECGQHASTEAGNSNFLEIASLIMQTIVVDQVPPPLLHLYLCIWVTLSFNRHSQLYTYYHHSRNISHPSCSHFQMRC